jgi:transposase InsO family protein
MDNFTKWPDVYAIPNQEASTVAEALGTNFFCRFGIPRELHSDQGRNFESHLLQEVLQRLGVSKTRTTSLHPQSDGMVERYVKTIEENLQKVVTNNQRDWDEKLPLFLLSYTASTHDTMGLTPVSLPATCCLECPQTKNDPHPISRQSWWTSYMTSTIMPDET